MTVFVSYSSRDKDAVKGLTQDLQDADEQVWLDQRLAGGEAWWRAILEQIRGCDVFIFALSQHSIESKPCQAELQYAQALGLPILPVQVGPVDSMSLNPVATVQAIDYRHQTPNTGMRLIAALNRERARRQPVPSPLPDEPEVPFEYLIRLFTTISNPDYLTPRDQAALVAQLQVGLGEDGQHEAARNDIVMLLTKLHDREDATHRTRTDVEAILTSVGAKSPMPPPIATETITPIEEQAGSIAPPASTGPPSGAEHEPAGKDRTTLDRPTDKDLPTQSDDQRATATTSDEPTSAQKPRESSDIPVGSATTQTTAPSSKQPPLQRLNRRTKIALIASALALAVIIAAAVGIPAVGHKSSQTSPPAQTSGSSQPSSAAEASAYGSQVVLPFTGLDSPKGVAVDTAGSVYVCDGQPTTPGRVLKLAAGATTQTELPFTDLKEPTGAAVDTAGSIYVADTYNNRILKLPAGANTPTELPFNGLHYPYSVAVDSAGNVYVADSRNNRVLKLPAGTTTQTELPFGPLQYLDDVAVDTAGNVYATDHYGDQVLKLAAGAATATVLFSLPGASSVAVDSAGSVYAISGNRVVKLAPGTSMTTDLPFMGLGNAEGVAVDSGGNVYVADSLNNRVVKLPRAPSP